MPGTHFIRKCCIGKRPSPVKECIIHSGGVSPNPYSIPWRLEAFRVSQSSGVLPESTLVSIVTSVRIV